VSVDDRRKEAEVRFEAKQQEADSAEPMTQESRYVLRAAT
jgi:hypothetical protein